MAASFKRCFNTSVSLNCRGFRKAGRMLKKEWAVE